MVSKDRTKREILAAAKRLADGRSIEQLTVADICAEAQVSRQTFYRHFSDKYDVTTWYVQALLEGAFDELGDTIGWREAYLREFRNIEASVRDSPAALNAFVDSADYNSIVPSTGRSGCEDFAACYRRRYGTEPSEGLAYQMKWFAVTASLASTDWIESGCPVPPELMADRIVSLIPRELFEALDV